MPSAVNTEFSTSATQQLCKFTASINPGFIFSSRIAAVLASPDKPADEIVPLNRSTVIVSPQSLYKSAPRLNSHLLGASNVAKNEAAIVSVSTATKYQR